MIFATIIALIVTAGWFRLIWQAIQHGQLLGKWQDVLERNDKKGRKWVKAFGYCEFCTAHTFAYIGFIGLAIYASGLAWYEWILLYIVFTPVSAWLNYKIIK